ncbi:hypothetical protein BFJ66_g13875 [Fusarium oxysporum f. sp. cepae]|uniref:Uncharacterized protein n=1 Tax=Fusarium oxysporum f. sp. cepae TaxID=396571 RepID=A0A3L6MYN2_FUSOX|nr:hypothetical protein BFJ65_g15981 [Fusarium oxysporum f. sp. cepae]RKK35632.1 hypothetical protein BFJ66_g13875 [Fusarium oxysporum f. sp. cepae]RKK45075.1 hypothetical protein BFJ67_g8841 [Fusarium oxysporum f. sp. cepae]
MSSTSLGTRSSPRQTNAVVASVSGSGRSVLFSNWNQIGRMTHIRSLMERIHGSEDASSGDKSNNAGPDEDETIAAAEKYRDVHVRRTTYLSDLERIGH